MQEKESGKRRSRLRWIVPIVVVLLIILLACSPIRKRQAEKRAARFTREHPVSTEYEVPGSISDHKEYACELLRLICWEEETKAALDQTYAEVSSGDWTDVRSMDQVNGYGKAEDLYRAALTLEWSRARKALDDTTRGAITALCAQVEPGAGIFSQESIEKRYTWGEFSQIARFAAAAENGTGKEILPVSEYISFAPDSSSWERLYVEAAGLVWPDKVKDACWQYIKDCSGAAEAGTDHHAAKTLENAVTMALFLEEQCEITFDDMTPYQKQVERLVWESKPDVPYEGMSVSAAFKTKLGKPDEYTCDYYQSKKRSISSYTYGKMVWYNEEGDCIFYAGHRNDLITEVTDNRSHPFHIGRRSDSSYSSSSGSNSSSSDEIDPDDYDLDGYYEDRQDADFDYDDIYDEFLDDEDAWDDY